MIQLANVFKQFQGRPAVNGVSLTVQPGEIFGLVGPDGAGKSTIIRLLTGLLQADDGLIEVLGSQEIETVKEHLGYIPQKFSLYGDLSVWENLRVIGALYGQSGPQIAERGEAILSFTKLLPFKDRLAEHLSGGMKQKLALAAGLMHKPRLFFLDEPTTGVDPVSRREFWQMLYQLNKDGTTIFVSTPYMDEAELCSRIAFLHEGRLISSGSPAQLKAAYPHQLLELQTATKRIKPFLQGLVLDLNAFGGNFHLAVDNAAEKMPLIRQRLVQAGVEVQSLRQIQPTLEDIFVALVAR